MLSKLHVCSLAQTHTHTHSHPEDMKVKSTHSTPSSTYLTFHLPFSPRLSLTLQVSQSEAFQLRRVSELFLFWAHRQGPQAQLPHGGVLHTGETHTHTHTHTHSHTHTVTHTQSHTHSHRHIVQHLTSYLFSTCWHTPLIHLMKAQAFTLADFGYYRNTFMLIFNLNLLPCTEHMLMF